MQLRQATRILLASAVAATATAHATVVNFNDQAQWGNTANFVSDGYRFVTTSAVSNILTAVQVCGPACPVSGSMELLLPYGPSSVTMSAANGHVFNLDSFLGAASFDFNDNGFTSDLPTTLTVTGRLAAGGAVTQSFALATIGSGPLPFTLDTLNSSFNGLSAVSFSSTGSADALFNGFTLDDIKVSAVSESSSLAMMLGGLGALGAMVRRRRAV